VSNAKEAQEQLPKTKTPHEQESLKRTIAATDKQIDQLVYELYGLTEEERNQDSGKLAKGGSKYELHKTGIHEDSSSIRNHTPRVLDFRCRHHQTRCAGEEVPETGQAEAV
jgi:hypothetical protein